MLQEELSNSTTCYKNNTKLLFHKHQINGIERPTAELVIIHFNIPHVYELCCNARDVVVEVRDIFQFLPSEEPRELFLSLASLVK